MEALTDSINQTGFIAVLYFVPDRTRAMIVTNTMFYYKKIRMTKIRLTRTFNSLFGAVVIVGLSVIGTNAYAQQEEIDQLFQLAEQGDANAQNALGFRYLLGDGVPQDNVEAAKWSRLAAEQGMAGAQYNLGFMYSNGTGVPQDYTEALKWYRLAAAQGNVGAQHDLGLMYEQGKGVPQDYVEAHKWFNLAASRLPSELRDLSVNIRDETAKKMTPDQIAEAQRLAREWEKAHGGN